MTERPTPTYCEDHCMRSHLERELSEAREKAAHWEAKCHAAWERGDEQTRQRMDADTKLEAYQTVLNLIGERLPDCPVIGDYPGGIDLLKQKLERRDALLREALTVVKLADELCDAFDNQADDIGGSRPINEILEELGAASQDALECIQKELA